MFRASSSCVLKHLRPGFQSACKYSGRRCINTPSYVPNSQNKRFFLVISGISIGTFAAYKANQYTNSNSFVQCEEDVASETAAADIVKNFIKEGVEEKKPEDVCGKWTLYQYQRCPFCSKVRAFFDYYGIEYEKVEVEPLFKKQIKFSSYRKVPFVRKEGSDIQINDSSLVISLMKSHYLGKEKVEKLLTYYPFLEDPYGDKKKWFWQKKSGGSYQNIYNVMYHQGWSKPQHNAIKEEMKWRRWVDEVFVHTLSPNIYRTMSESMQAMEYIAESGKFETWEVYSAKYAGAVVMYIVGRLVKSKYNLHHDVRKSLYEEAQQWSHAVGKRRFLGGKQPNLADLNMYGVISAIEGLDAFEDLMKSTDISPWYTRMKRHVTSHRGANDPDWLSLVKEE